MYKKRPRYQIEKEAGFTLLEVIAVLVILSILAVVAVPKYFDLQGQAREKAMNMAVAEAIARINSYFATQLLAGNAPADIVYDTVSVNGEPPSDPNKGNMGDFDMEILSSSDSEINIRVTPKNPAFGAGFIPVETPIPNPGYFATEATPTPTPQG